jgi:sulfur-oxidizing protein SoxZ
MARTLITIPTNNKRGEIIEIRALIQHPMETGYRRGSDGVMLKRDLIRRFTCNIEIANMPSETIFSAALYAAVAANPFISFHYQLHTSGTLVFTWIGDNGFTHTERRALVVAQ